jgi:peptidyl-dipeptidase A
VHLGLRREDARPVTRLGVNGVSDARAHGRAGRHRIHCPAVPGAQEVVSDLVEALRPIEVELAQAWWEASTHASEDVNRRKAELELTRRRLLADSDAFAAVETARGAADLDADLRRHLDLLHDAMVPNQVPEDLQRRIVELESDVEATFTSFRGELDGERVTDNTILDILRGSEDSDLRRQAWEASKQVGAAVAGPVRDLARLRNEAARSVGYRDHFALALGVGEMDEGRLLATLDEVDRYTGAPFEAWKRELDERLAARFEVAPGDLAPWHLDDPFFQDPPTAGALDLDARFADADLEALTVRTYDGLGLDVRPVLARSDLYGRDGKNQHAFCIDIDREGDVRVLCNVEPSERWMDTMLHEFGHAVYNEGVAPTLPWLVRDAAHALTTEGVAMLFGRLVHSPEWLGQVAGFPASELEKLRPRLAEARRASLLVFARWVLVVTHFERRLYADPDGDLDTWWWDLVERYQHVRRPPGRAEPDWASKIHLAVVPVYYQNYLYGELFASQLESALTARAGGFVDRREAGRFLADAVFAPGASRRWDQLVREATGEPLTAAHLAAHLAA